MLRRSKTGGLKNAKENACVPSVQENPEALPWRLARDVFRLWCLRKRRGYIVSAVALTAAALRVGARFLAGLTMALLATSAATGTFFALFTETVIAGLVEVLTVAFGATPLAESL